MENEGSGELCGSRIKNHQRAFLKSISNSKNRLNYYLIIFETANTDIPNSGNFAGGGIIFLKTNPGDIGVILCLIIVKFKR